MRIHMVTPECVAVELRQAPDEAGCAALIREILRSRRLPDWHVMDLSVLPGRHTSLLLAFPSPVTSVRVAPDLAGLL